MPEQVFFSDSAVQITEAEAVFGGIRVPVSQIASARFEAFWPTGGWLGPAAGAAFAAGFLVLVLKWLAIPEGTLYYSVSYWIQDLATLAGLILLSIWAYHARYIVMVTGAFGEKSVVIARRYSYARRVVKAIKEAAKLGKRGGTLLVSR